MDEGSIPRTEEFCMVSRAEAVSFDAPALLILGPSSEMSMRTVWSGNSGSQLSICGRG